MLTALGLILLGYLLGAIPTGYWTVQALKGVDIRQVGSRSTGATNVLRTAGRAAAAFVFMMDILKGLAPVLLSEIAEARGFLTTVPQPELHLVPPLVAAAALIGHSRSIFLNFQGGKSAATGLGTLIALNPLVAAVSFSIWLLTLFSTRFVSLASILAVACSGAIMLLFRAPWSYVGYCVLGAAFVVYRHKANISRLLSGSEPRLGEKSRQTSEAQPAQALAADPAAGDTPGQHSD